MPAGRFISKSIAVNKQLRKVSLPADYLFERCIPHLDREGRLEGDPEVVRATVCPLRPEMTAEVVEDCLRQLHDAELVVWYEAEGDMYLSFPGFKNHQTGMKHDREAPSRIPKPPMKVRTSGEGPAKVRTKSGVNPEPVRTRSSDVVATSGTNSDNVADQVPLREVKRSEVKLRTTNGEAPEKPSPFPKSVCDALYETWTEVRGAIDYGAFRKALKPLYPTSGPRYSQDVLTEAIKAHAEYVEGLQPREAGFETIHKFAADVQRWVRIGGMPAVDPDTRELTERGRLALA
jgi:hypothetical protein